MDYTICMADLSYQDIQRAVQDGVRNMQSDTQRITSEVMNQAAKLSQRFDELQRDVTQMQSELSRHDPRSEQTTQQIMRDLQDLRMRFENVERFCREMSEYFRARNEADKEDQGYRGV